MSAHNTALRRRIAIVSAVAAGGLLLAACGGNDMEGMDHGSGNSASATAPQSSGDKPAPGAFNDADVMFAQMMIEHHEGAITMAEDEQKNGRDAKAKKLAAAVVKTQTAEVEKFQKILDRL